MNLPQIPIKDKIFAHCKFSSGCLPSTYFEWDYSKSNKPYIFLTDLDVFDVELYKGIKRYAWLVESPVIMANSYEFVYNNWEKFELIFTQSKKILTRPNARLLPLGGCHLEKNEISFNYEKTKLISMMYSNKNWTSGHSIRHSVASEFGNVVDLMGSGVTGVNLKKIHSCKDYMYSIAIENCKEDYYFSEKIIDCFLSGVIPIYWGCPSIGNFFNLDGIFTFDNIQELYDILKNQEYLYSFYLKNKDGVIKENYQTAMKYKIAEDYLFLNYNYILTSH